MATQTASLTRCFGGPRQGIFLLAVLVFAALPLWQAPLAYQFAIIIAHVLAASAVAILLRAGLISFGHGLYYAVGAYTVAYLAPLLQAGVVVLLLAGGLVAGVAALICGLFVVRYRGIFFAMLNLALSMVAYTVLLKFYNVTGGSDGMVVAVSQVAGVTLDSAAFGRTLFFVCLGLVAVAGWCIQRFLRSPLGWGLTAVQHCEVRVEYLGRSARSVLLVAYVFSGILAGLGGAVAAIAVGHVVPQLAYWTTSAEFLVIAVIGGIGNVLGPFAGAVLYQLLSVNMAQYLTYTWGLLLGVVILLIIRFAPTGLWGIYDGLWARWGGR